VFGRHASLHFKVIVEHQKGHGNLYFGGWGIELFQCSGSERCHFVFLLKDADLTWPDLIWQKNLT
jgi:hypothetical protein